MFINFYLTNTQNSNSSHFYLTDILTDWTLRFYQIKRSGNCRSLSSSKTWLRMIFIFVFSLAFIFFILAIAMLLRQKRISCVIWILMPGYNDAKVILFI